ncbi:MAG: metallophosphoesterase [Pseudomonadota bacterium]
MSDLGPLEYMKLTIFYASYLYFPAAAYLVLKIAKQRGAKRLLAAIAFAALTLLAYARFVEPRILLTVEHEASLSRCFPEAGSARLALFSDTHEGIFANAVPVSRIARKVNAAKPDAVLIAGDFVYFLAPDRFEKTFKELQAIDAPVFAVLGNHDVGLPGPDVGAPLTAALRTLDVHLLNNAQETLALNGATAQIAGLSELWAKGQNRTLLERRGAVPRIVLTHNPSTILDLRPREAVDILIAGHTHGGQINIPFITSALTSACHVTRYGFAQTPRGLVFVTSGTGMVGLPMRLNAPPRIDVINLRWRACS